MLPVKQIGSPQIYNRDFFFFLVLSIIQLIVTYSFHGGLAKRCRLTSKLASCGCSCCCQTSVEEATGHGHAENASASSNRPKAEIKRPTCVKITSSNSLRFKTIDRKFSINPPVSDADTFNFSLPSQRPHRHQPPPQRVNHPAPSLNSPHNRHRSSQTPTTKTKKLCKQKSPQSQTAHSERIFLSRSGSLT